MEEARVIFKAVREGRPYPDHGYANRQWVEIPPTQVSLSTLVTTTSQLDLKKLLDEDSTFFGDMFAHVVEWRGELYLEDGVHRALRCALAQRNVLHARVLRLPDAGLPDAGLPDGGLPDEGLPDGGLPDESPR